MKDVVIVAACRTAIGAFGKTLRDSNAAFLGSVTMKEVVKRAGIDPALIDDVRYGCCLEHADSLNTARVASLLAGIPDTVPAATINRVCISGMEAVISGMAMIQAEMADVILAGGVEHMSGAAYTVPNARWGCRLQDQVFVDSMIRALHCGSYIMPHPEDGPVNADEAPLKFFKGKPYIMGHTAEFIAQYMDISREEMDQVALKSQNEAERATNDGSFADEIVPVELVGRNKKVTIFDKDEHFRPGLTLEQLAALPPAFVPKIGKVTAGNSSGLNDGSAGMMIMSADKAKELGVTPMAKIKAIGKGACHPSVMGLSPTPAVNNLMERSGLAIKDFELVELNEAFAVQSLAVLDELKIDPAKVNVNGGAIALGHPIGSSGTRITVTLIHQMKRQNAAFGIASLCVGGGMGLAILLENI